MEETTVGRRQIISVIFFWKVSWTQTLIQTNLKAQNTHKQLANTPKYLLCNPQAFCLLHPCISNIAYQHACCSLMHGEGHVVYFQGFGLFITASSFLYSAKTVLT